MSELCHHAWVGDDECAYCKSEELEGLLSECMNRIAELEISNQRLREALLNLNAAIDYHWNDSFTGVQRMPDAHAKMIVAAQQVAKQALCEEIEK